MLAVPYIVLAFFADVLELHSLVVGAAAGTVELHWDDVGEFHSDVVLDIDPRRNLLKSNELEL